MNPEVWMRLGISVALVTAGVAAFLLFNRVTLRRAESKVDRLPAYRPGIPALVYFTTPTCAPCKTVQRPAIRQMQENFGRGFQLIEIDASQLPHLAEEWGVVSVPTTFVIDSRGAPRYVNHGVTKAKTLIQQLEIEDYSI